MLNPGRRLFYFYLITTAPSASNIPTGPMTGLDLRLLSVAAPVGERMYRLMIPGPPSVEIGLMPTDLLEGEFGRPPLYRMKSALLSTGILYCSSLPDLIYIPSFCSFLRVCIHSSSDNVIFDNNDDDWGFKGSDGDDDDDDDDAGGQGSSRSATLAVFGRDLGGRVAGEG